MQAYFEWLPIRPWSEGNNEEIYRSFSFGDLVDLHMLDTRILARDEQLEYTDYFDYSTYVLDEITLNADLTDTNRTMIGTEQMTWLQEKATSSTGQWEVLGQQVLMGKMYLPGAVALGIMSTTEYVELGTIAVLAARNQAGDTTLTNDEAIYLNENSERLTDDVITQLSLPDLPYNLDAWDGYAADRDTILNAFNDNNQNLIVLAGDTHNAWANELSNSEGKVMAVEFATSSISSPGLEYYLGISDDAADVTEAGLVSLIDGLKYVNSTNRGFLTVTFTQEAAQADWYFVDTILSTDYETLTTRQTSAATTSGTPSIILS